MATFMHNGVTAHRGEPVHYPEKARYRVLFPGFPDKREGSPVFCKLVLVYMLEGTGFLQLMHPDEFNIGMPMHKFVADNIIMKYIAYLKIT